MSGGTQNEGIDVDVENLNSTFSFVVEYRVFNSETTEVLHYNSFTVLPSSSTVIDAYIQNEYSVSTTHRIEAIAVINTVTGERISVKYDNVFRPIDYSGVTSSPTCAFGHSKVIFRPNECELIERINDTRGKIETCIP